MLALGTLQRVTPDYPPFQWSRVGNLLLECGKKVIPWNFNLGHKSDTFSPLSVILEYFTWRKPAVILWGNSRMKNQAPAPLPPSSSISMSAKQMQSFWNQVFQIHSSFQVTADPAAIFTATSWDTLNQNHAAELLLNSSIIFKRFLL